MACLRLILLAACLAAAVARPMSHAEDATSSASRNLLQVAFCPDGCAPGNCIQDATKGGLRCQACLGTLVVNKITGECACPAGRYSENNSTTCKDCPKGSYCPGDVYRPTADPPVIPEPRPCPPNMTTVGMRSISARACVNLPGFYYTLENNVPGAVQCPVNTYGPGLKKQRACVPCPTGFTTNFKVLQTLPTACIVPAGYYLKAPGQVAPCPRGEWKAGIGTSGNCSKCAFGVTTPAEASTAESECNLLVPGYYAAAFAADGNTITRAVICPQGYYCPGGNPGAAFDPANPGALSPTETTIKKCPNNMLTVDVGAIAVEQCLVPPGYYITGNPGVLTQCPNGTYRAAWKPASDAGTCSSCGEGVKADTTDRVTIYNIVTGVATQIQVTSSSDDCYIMPGQGLYYNTLTATWRARNCEVDSYGVTNKTYGLSPSACRDCPSGQVATIAPGYPVSASYYVNNGDGTGGFISVKACVNKPGFGYNGRVSQRCDQGFYNPGDTYGTCSPCGYGLTTSGVGAGVTVADCGVGAGFGNFSGTIAPCPIGTYNGANYTAAPGVQGCTDCPGFTTTATEGAANEDACSLCDAGYGGDNNCATACGGVGNVASYGTAGREVGTNCTLCSTQNTGFSFHWMMDNDIWQAQAVSRTAANASGDCLSEFTQVVDQAWYLPIEGNLEYAPEYTLPANAGPNNEVLVAPAISGGSQPARQINEFTSGVLSWDACATLCKNAPRCMLATYDYRSQTCYRRYGDDQTFLGAPLVAMKAIPSGDVTASSKTVQTKSGAVASGQYTFWKDEFVEEFKNQVAPANAATFTSLQDCLSACDDNVECAGITILMAVETPGPPPSTNRPKTCRMIFGDTTNGVFKRTMTRMDVTKLALPALI